MPENSPVDVLGERVRKARLRLRSADGRRPLSQGDLAKRVKVGLNTISAIENGRRPRDPELIVRLARALDVDVAWLLGTADEVAPGGEVSAPILPAEEAEPGQTVRGAPRVAMGLPFRIRVWLQEFLLEITKAGATEEEVNEARDLLTAPEVFVYFSGGAPKEFSEDDALMTMEAIADGVIRPGLRRRGRKL